MIKRGDGAIFFTGASASIKGYAKSSPFAMGKFALRGLAESLARELAPHGVHVAPFRHRRRNPRPRPHRGSRSARVALLDPEAIAETYLHALRQPRSAWTWEFQLRPVGRAVLRGRRQGQSREAISAVSLRIIASPNLPKSSIGSTKAPGPPMTLSR